MGLDFFILKKKKYFSFEVMVGSKLYRKMLWDQWADQQDKTVFQYNNGIIQDKNSE